MLRTTTMLLLVLLCAVAAHGQVDAPLDVQRDPPIVLGNKPPKQGNNTTPNYLGTCLKIFNRCSVPIRVERWFNSDQHGRRAYLNRDEDVEYCGYNDDDVDGYKYDVMLKISRFVPGYGWGGVQVVRAHNPGMASPWIQVCNKCNWATHRNMNACSWYQGKDDYVNRRLRNLGEGESWVQFVIKGDNPSFGYGFRKNDRDNHKRMEYDIREVPALCYNRMCKEDWQRAIANVLK